MAAIARIIGYALAGGVVLPLAVLALMLVVYAMDSRCGSPGIPAAARWASPCWC